MYYIVPQHVGHVTLTVTDIQLLEAVALVEIHSSESGVSNLLSSLTSRRLTSHPTTANTRGGWAISLQRQGKETLEYVRDHPITMPRTPGKTTGLNTYVMFEDRQYLISDVMQPGYARTWRVTFKNPHDLLSPPQIAQRSDKVGDYLAVNLDLVNSQMVNIMREAATLAGTNAEIWVQTLT